MLQKQSRNKNVSFSDAVRAVVRSIPLGKTLSYKEVAIQAGNPLAFRAVARVMAANYDPTVPCHRVIRADGKMGGYNRGGIVAKEKLLAKEKQAANI